MKTAQNIPRRENTDGAKKQEHFKHRIAQFNTSSVIFYAHCKAVVVTFVPY